MVKKNTVKIFGEDRIRAVWDVELEKWFFSIVDVVAVLTGSVNPQTYWRVLKKRLKDEGNETVTNCNGLKMLAPDGRMRVTDVADTEQLLRIVQSIPSPKAEPFKVWLAKVGAELSATSIKKAKNPQTLDENKVCAKEGGDVARVARETLESKTKVISPLSAKRFFEAQTPTPTIEDHNDDPVKE